VAAAAATAHQDLATNHLPVVTKNPVVVISHHHHTVQKYIAHTKTQQVTLILILMQEQEKHIQHCILTTSPLITTVKQATTLPHSP